MKSHVTIGIVIGAGCLFTSVPPAHGQQVTPGAVSVPAAAATSATSISRPQLLPSRGGPPFPSSPVVPGARPQQSLSPLPAPTPRSRKKFVRRNEVAEPVRQAGSVPPRPTSPVRHSADSKTRTTSDSSPARVKSKKSLARNERSERSHPEGGEQRGAAGAHNQRNDHQTAPTRQEPERTIAIPMRTPPNPAAGPVRLPEATPIISTSAPPPIATAPAEHLAPAQAPPPPAPARSSRPILNDLSQDERAKLHTAHQTALHDPNLAESRTRYLNARKEFRDKLRDALLKADPSVQPILEKIRRDKPEDR